MTTAADWFSDEHEFRQLCGDAQSQARGKSSQDFAAEMLVKAKEHGLGAYLSVKQLEWLCKLADWDMPKRRSDMKSEYTALAGPTRTADQPSVALAKSCVWSQCDEDGDFYDTGCGHAFSFTDGTPTDNEFTHCCFCGLPLDEVKWTDEDVSVDPDHCPVSTTGDHWVKTDIPGKCVYCGASVPTTAEGTEK